MKNKVIIIIINKRNMGISLVSGWEFNQICINMKHYTVEIEVGISRIELALFELTILRMFIDR